MTTPATPTPLDEITRLRYEYAWGDSQDSAVAVTRALVDAALAQDARGNQSSPRLRAACVAYRAWRPDGGDK